MSSETTFVARKWGRWRGTPEDIARIAQRMEDLLKSAQVSKTDVEVKVERNNRKTIYNSAAEAGKGLPSADLKNLKQIRLSGGTRFDPGLSVILYIGKHDTQLKVEGSGDHHISVAGIAKELTAQVDRGSRSLPHQKWIIIALLVAVLLFMGGHAASWAADADELSDIFAIAWLIPLMVFYAIVIIRPIFVPTLEILRDGEQSRASRWGRPLLTLGDRALTLVIGAILGLLFESWWG